MPAEKQYDHGPSKLTNDNDSDEALLRLWPDRQVWITRQDADGVRYYTVAQQVVVVFQGVLYFRMICLQIELHGTLSACR